VRLWAPSRPAWWARPMSQSSSYLEVELATCRKCCTFLSRVKSAPASLWELAGLARVSVSPLSGNSASMSVARENEAKAALFQAFVACNIAKDAIPDLPVEIARVVEEPIQRFCEVVGAEVEKFRPDLIGPS
jgi:hypothetical protein